MTLPPPYPARSGFLVPWQAELLAKWRSGRLVLGPTRRFRLFTIPEFLERYP